MCLSREIRVLETADVPSSATNRLFDHHRDDHDDNFRQHDDNFCDHDDNFVTVMMIFVTVMIISVTMMIISVTMMMIIGVTLALIFNMVMGLVTTYKIAAVCV